MRRGTLIVVALVGLRAAAAADVTIDVHDSLGHPVADAVVYAEPAQGNAPAVRSSTRALIDQVNKEFVPRVSVVQAGTSVFFPNSDNIRHSLYSFSAAKIFTTKLYSGREAPPVLFDKSGLVVLGCNIHDKMVAWVYVVDTPWFDRSGADGVGTLKGLPAGQYRITAAAPAASLKALTVDISVEGTGALRRMMSLSAGP